MAHNQGNCTDQAHEYQSYLQDYLRHFLNPQKEMKREEAGRKQGGDREREKESTQLQA